MHQISAPARTPACAFVAMAVALSGAAWGQTPEEITVTARKREESLQDVPVSITAFTADQLQEVGAFNNQDVALLTVNFNTMQQTGRRLDRPVIRGMNAPSSRGEPNASYFIDGVFVSGSITTATLGPIERVEIIRGPQSAQFGRATFSGAVNYITREPTNEYAGEVLTRARSNDSYTVTAWGSGPVIEDKLLFFATAGWDRLGDQWTNELGANVADPTGFVGADGVSPPPQQADTSGMGGTDTKDVAFKLKWNATDSTAISYKIGYTKGNDSHYMLDIIEPGELNCFLPTDGAGNTVDNTGQPWYSTSGGAYCGTVSNQVNYVPENPFAPGNSPYPEPWAEYNIPGAPVQGGDRQSRVNLPDFYNGIGLPQVACESPFVGGTFPEDCLAAPVQPGTRREQWRHLLQLDQSLGNSGDMVVRLAYNKDELEQAFDLDHTEQRMFPANLFNFFQQQTIEDKSFEAIYTSPGDYRVRGSAGVYWYDKDFKSRQRSFPGPGLADFSDYTLRDTTNRSVFGSIEIDLTDTITFSYEARYASDELGILGANKTQAQKTFYNYTPRYTLRYIPRDNLSFYGQIAKGNKPGDFNIGYFAFDIPREVGDIAAGNLPEDLVAYPNTRNGDANVKEEEQTTYEIGAKTSWFDRRVLANVAVFYIDWENQGVFGTELIDQGNGATKPDTIIRNAGQSRIYGFELESTYVVTQRFIVNLSVGLTDAEFVKFNDVFYANTTGIDDPDLVNDGNVAGNTVPNSPRWNVVSALNYSRPLAGDLEWFGRTDYIYESKRYTQAANFMRIEERHLWNGRLGLGNDKWTATVFVNNILDRETPTSIVNFIDLNNSWNNGGGGARGNAVELWSTAPTPGRNWGLEFVYRFNPGGN